MKTIFAYFIVIFAIGTAVLTSSCSDDEPIDEDGLLITKRTSCYMTLFNVLGSDNRTVLVPEQAATPENPEPAKNPMIDTVNQTVVATVKFGTNIKRLKPFCSVVLDAKVEPNMGVWTDFTSPQSYTIVSGNRKVRKTYTITLVVQQ